MVRYIGLDRYKNKIFVTFAFSHDGSIKLVPRDDFEIHDRETRDLKAVSISDLKAWVVKNVNVNKLLTLQKGSFVRGNADSFTKRAGNLHMIARPLRQAVYSRLGHTTVHEFVPVWDAVVCSVVWVDEFVEADKALDALLDDPRKAMAWLVEADALAESVLSDFEKVSRSHSRSMIIAEYMGMQHLFSAPAKRPPIGCFNPVCNKCLAPNVPSIESPRSLHNFRSGLSKSIGKRVVQTTPWSCCSVYLSCYFHSEPV